MPGCGSTAVTALFARGDREIPSTRSPGAGADGAAGAVSARRNAYWPEEDTVVSSAAPPDGTESEPTARHAPAVSSHCAATTGRPVATLNGLARERVAGVAKLIPCGVMSAAAIGDQPAGSTPCSPCCKRGVSARLVAVGSAPAGRLRPLAPFVTF